MTIDHSRSLGSKNMILHRQTYIYFTISLILAVVCWLLLEAAESHARFLLERNLNSISGDFSSIEQVSHSFNIYVLIFTLFPAFVILFLNGSGGLQKFILVILLVLLVFDANLYLSGDGGDRKGCDSCLLMILLHVGIGMLSPLLLAWHWSISTTKKCTRIKRDNENKPNKRLWRQPPSEKD